VDAGWLLKKSASQAETIYTTFKKVWPYLNQYITQKLEPKMAVLECMYVRQAIDLLEGLIPSADDVKDIPQPYLQKLIVFAIMWSLGALLELDDRKKVMQYHC
jgi:dynein heavy chain